MWKETARFSSVVKCLNVIRGQAWGLAGHAVRTTELSFPEAAGSTKTWHQSPTQPALTKQGALGGAQGSQLGSQQLRGPGGPEAGVRGGSQVCRHRCRTEQEKASID